MSPDGPDDRKETMFAVIYASAGCLPDSDAVEFYGSADECEAWIEANAEDYERPDVTHDLYSLEIIEVSDDEAHDFW
jgi:hypothetical protein